MYYLDDGHISIDEMATRIQGSDLVPSRQILKESLHEVCVILKHSGIQTLAELRKRCKTPKSMQVYSKEVPIALQFLVLLRREIESWFPKPVLIEHVNHLPHSSIMVLKNSAIRTTKELYERPFSDIKQLIGIEQATCLYALASLCRLPWTSALFAYMLYEAGYHTIEDISCATAEELCKHLKEINDTCNYFKGTIGLRDCKRIVYTAKWYSTS